jgi:hypothetical protein
MGVSATQASPSCSRASVSVPVAGWALAGAERLPGLAAEPDPAPSAIVVRGRRSCRRERARWGAEREILAGSAEPAFGPMSGADKGQWRGESRFGDSGWGERGSEGGREVVGCDGSSRRRALLVWCPAAAQGTALVPAGGVGWSQRSRGRRGRERGQRGGMRVEWGWAVEGMDGEE